MSIGSTTISEVHRQLPGDVIRNETIVNGVSSSQITPETTRKCTKTHHFCMPLRNSPIQKCHFLVPQKSHRPNESEGETENDTVTGKETETAPIAAHREGKSIETCISSVTQFCHSMTSHHSKFGQVKRNMKFLPIYPLTENDRGAANVRSADDDRKAETVSHATKRRNPTKKTKKTATNAVECWSVGLATYGERIDQVKRQQKKGGAG